MFSQATGRERQFGPLSTNIAINIYFFHFFDSFHVHKTFWSSGFSYVVFKNFHMLKGSVIKREFRNYPGPYLTSISPGIMLEVGRGNKVLPRRSQMRGPSEAAYSLSKKYKFSF